MDKDSTHDGHLKTYDTTLWVYKEYEKEKQRRKDIEEELKTLQGIHTTLMSNFNIHMKICKSYDWQGGL